MAQALRQCGYGWQGTWENMDRCLERFTPPMVWNFSPEQVWNPDEVIEYLGGKKRFPGYSKEAETMEAEVNLFSKR